MGAVSAVVVLFKCLLPGRLEVLHGGLAVEPAGQQVEQLGVLPPYNTLSYSGGQRDSSLKDFIMKRDGNE